MLRYLSGFEFQEHRTVRTQSYVLWLPSNSCRAHPLDREHSTVADAISPVYVPCLARFRFAVLQVCGTLGSRYFKREGCMRRVAPSPVMRWHACIILRQVSHKVVDERYNQAKYKVLARVKWFLILNWQTSIINSVRLNKLVESRIQF